MGGVSDFRKTDFKRMPDRLNRALHLQMRNFGGSNILRICV
jgi:hypothetical protein